MVIPSVKAWCTMVCKNHPLKEEYQFKPLRCGLKVEFFVNNKGYLYVKGLSHIVCILEV